MRDRRRMYTRALTAAVVPAALLIPQHSSAAGSAAAPTSIVYDPGPKLRCYSVSDETGQANYGNDSRDCGAIDHPYRVNKDCSWFGYTSERGVECPAWRFVTYNWPRERLTQYPGYDHQVHGNSGEPLKLVMQNNSKNIGSCDLKEVAFSYEYIGSSLRRHADGREYHFSDGRLNVSYDAMVQQTGGFACDEKRAILTTDFIYNTRGNKKNLISVVHYDPGSFSPPNQDGVLWTNRCRDEATGAPAGCRVTVAGQRIDPGSTSRIDIDFTDLARTYDSYLGGDPIPTPSQIEAVQIVNSTKGADLMAQVSNADVTLE